MRSTEHPNFASIAFFVFVLLCSVRIDLYADEGKVDSLLMLAERADTDSLRYDLLDQAASSQAEQNRAAIIPILREKYDLAQKMKSSYKIAESAEQLARNFLYASENDSAMVYVDIALPIFKDLDPFQYGINLNNKALIYQRTNEYEKAVETYQEVIDHSDEIEDYIGSIYAYLNLMSIAMDLKDETKAISYLDAIESTSARISNSDTLAISELNNVMPSVYLNIGQSFRDLGQIDSSIFYFDKAETSLKDVSYEYLRNYTMGYIEHSRGDQFYRLYENDKSKERSRVHLNTALSHYQAAYDLFTLVENQRGKAFSANDLGKVLIDLGEYQEAKMLLDEAFTIATDVGFKEEIRDSYKYQSQYEEEVGNPQSALALYKEYDQYKDSVRNEDRDRMKQGLDIRFETAKRQEAIAELALENERKEKEKETQRYVFIISSILGLGAFLGIFSWWRMMKQKEQINFEQELNTAMARFVPTAFIKAIGYDKIQEVRLGDKVQKDVTVVFTDIRGFTSISERLTPSENFDFVKRYVERMGPIIEANHGFISQYLGDGIMAIFEKSPNDALNACIGMQEEVDAFNIEIDKDGLAPINVGMGMHYGPLIMGVIGDEHRRDATLISDTVNTAARIETETKRLSEKILLSSQTVEKLENVEDYTLGRVGDVFVKGKSVLVTIYKCDF